MNDDTDFLKLYRQLGVEPGCTLLAFKQAYRRRVGELHPDRMDGGLDYSEGLKELNLHYAAALGFHRLHGRLPGTMPASAARFFTAPPRPERMDEPRKTRPPAMPHSPPNRWLLLVFSLVAIIPLWALIPNLDKDDKDARDPMPAAGVDPSTPIPTAVEVGMEASTVTALLGMPIIDADNGDHWVYGPSWVRFECGQVVDWYSSPLRPLPVADSRPAVSQLVKEPARRPPRCITRPQQESMVYPADTTLARHSGTA